jgi:transcriptional regulator with XRE-family HTH domain
MADLFGEKVRFVRIKRGISQVELAQQTGLASQAHISKLETGDDVPSLHVVVGVATALGVSVDYLLRDNILVEEPEILRYPEGLPESFGERLRALRARRGLSQGDLARQLGLAQRAYVSNLELGRKMPSRELAIKIADLFSVSIDMLLLPTARED